MSVDSINTETIAPHWIVMIQAKMAAIVVEEFLHEDHKQFTFHCSPA